MAEQQGDPKIPLVVGLQSRNGNMAGGQIIDAALVNAFIEPTAFGPAVVKRPGSRYMNSADTSYGAPTGAFYAPGGNPGNWWYITGNTLSCSGSNVAYTLSPGINPGAGQLYDFATGLNSGIVLIHSPNALWVFNATLGTAPVRVTDANYPALTVPGVVSLDSTWYVMDTSGKIWSSNTGDPTTWSALNFVQIDAGLGTPVALHRHLNYVVAFATNGLQLFYDAGNSPPGTPLLPVANATFKMGCYSAYSLCEFQDVTYFLASPTDGGVVAMALSGLSLYPLSDAADNRVLSHNTSPITPAYGTLMGGKNLYIVSCGAGSFVYDVDVKKSYWWTQGTSTAATLTYPGFLEVEFAPSSGPAVVLQDYNTGLLLMVSSDWYTDRQSNGLQGGALNSLAVNVTALDGENFSGSFTGAYIPVVVQSVPWDGGTLKRKFVPALHLIADTASTTVYVSYSDDDYQTFSTPAPINLASQRKQVLRCGSTRRRAWQFTHSDNSPLKLYAAEVELVLGAE